MRKKSCTKPRKTRKPKKKKKTPRVQAQGLLANPSNVNKKKRKKLELKLGFFLIFKLLSVPKVVRQCLQKNEKKRT
jgi:hypothetical protein